MDEEENKDESTVDKLVQDIAADRDKYKALYEKEKQAHAETLRKKLLNGNNKDDDEENDDGEDDTDADAVKRIKEKLFNRRK